MTLAISNLAVAKPMTNVNLDQSRQISGGTAIPDIPGIPTNTPGIPSSYLDLTLAYSSHQYDIYTDQTTTHIIGNGNIEVNSNGSGTVYVEREPG